MVRDDETEDTGYEREKNVQRVWVEYGCERLILELRDVRPLTPEDRAALEKALWNGLVEYVHGEVQEDRIDGRAALVDFVPMPATARAASS